MSLDPESLARFEREAKLLASVNHPNVATIYGVEDASGTMASSSASSAASRRCPNPS
jgi:serine/threonine-protein kinase